MKRKTNIYTKDHNGTNINPQIEIGAYKGYISGQLLDANAIVALVDAKIAEVINGASTAGDTLKELEDSIPTKISDLINDTGFITASQASDSAIVSVTANQPFPQSWPKTGNISDLVTAINNDPSATAGKIYLATVEYNDLPTGLQQAEMKVEIMNQTMLFTITSEDVSPYHWEATSAYGRLTPWRSFVASSVSPVNTEE